MTPAFAYNQIASPLGPFACAFFIVVSFILSGSAHVLWLHSAASQRLAIPIDFGMTLGGRRIFGDHKMLRGFVVIVPATGAAFYLLFAFLRSAAPAFAGQLWTLTPLNYALLGAWAGLGFIVGELPNSFIKRRLQIPPGELPADPIIRMLCLIVDRLDSIVGMLLALSLVVSMPLLTCAYVILAGVGIHWAFSVALFALGVKERMA